MTNEHSDTSWAQPTYLFRVEWDGETALFQEVSGMDVQADVLDYHAGDSPEFSTIRMPGLVKSSNVMLKHGTLASQNKIFDWFSEVSMNTVTRRTVTVSLLDTAGAPLRVWTLKNAFPVKINASDFKAMTSEIAIEVIEFAHEGIQIENG